MTPTEAMPALPELTDADAALIALRYWSKQVRRYDAAAEENPLGNVLDCAASVVDQLVSDLEAANSARDVAIELGATYAARLEASRLECERLRVVTPEMIRAAQCNSELGAHVCANMTGAYDLITELFNVMSGAAMKKERT